MFYDKQIKYLDMYEKGEKVQNAGFVRMEAQGDKVKVQLRAEKLRHTDTGKMSVMLVGDGKEEVLGEISLEEGKGILECLDLFMADMAGGIGYEEVCEIYLKLPGERILRCIIKERKKVEESEPEIMSESFLFQAPMPNPGSISEEMPPMAPQLEYEPEAAEGYEAGEPIVEPTLELEREPMTVQEVELAPEIQLMPRPEPVPRMEPVPRPEPVPRMEPMPRREQQPYPQPSPQLMPRAEQTPRSMSEPGPVLRPIPTAPLQERQSAATKWQQLSNIYPHIRPFEDGRDYLKIKPEDFVILTKKYYPLVTNSFLKHGYYNYEHLILSREMGRDGERFYIGVPGNFYEKEKQVAVLFGFESFEGKIEPARNGDFGYYMISVEI